MTATEQRAVAGGWTFDGFGPEFDVHVAAHLPGYMDAQKLVALVAQFLLPAGGVLADYGASTGQTVEVIRSVIPDRPFTAHLYDRDVSMLARAKERLGTDGVVTHVRSLPDPRLPDHPPADLSLALWLIQFLPPQQHREVLQQIRAGAADSGAVIIATKTRHRGARWEEIAVAALDDYKAEQGVDPEERTTKTRALRGTMFALDADRLIDDLWATGWVAPTVLWRWHVWTIIGAFASP